MIKVNEVKTILNKTNNNNSSITVSFRQPCTISAEYCFQNLYVLDYFVRLWILIFDMKCITVRTNSVLKQVLKCYRSESVVCSNYFAHAVIVVFSLFYCDCH